MTSRIWALGVIVCLTAPVLALDKTPEYEEDVVPILQKYCAGCHNANEREGDFSIETYDALLKGGEHGAAVLAGDPATSRLLRMVTGMAEPKMPPEDQPQPTTDEVAVLKGWVEAGAVGPSGQEPDRTQLRVPTIAPRSGLQDAVSAIDWSNDGKWIAEARFGRVVILDATTLQPTKTLDGIAGKVTAIHFAPEDRLITASGIPGLFGQAIIWDLTSGQPIREIKAHRDVLYDAEPSPSGEFIATCSYDRKIVLWNTSSGEQVRTFEGHTGAVYDVAFSPDGSALVSGSADDTCKVWQVATGERLDTLGQPLKEVYSVGFNPDGDLVTSVGADNRIRVWQFLSRTTPMINPQITARYAHEAVVTQMKYSSDGRYLLTAADNRSVKLWDAQTLLELKEYGQQSDVVQAIAFSPDGSRFVVGRVDGTLEVFDTVSPPSAPPEDDTRAIPTVTMTTQPMAEVTEVEPNDLPPQSQAITLPALVKGVVQGRTAGVPDADVYRFSGKAGEEWVIEVNAARSQSGLDSMIEVLDVQGQPVPRVKLQAVQNSYFTFRGKNGDEIGDFRVFNWEEMELNEYLYSNGEVAKLWLSPRGPDSGFLVYPGEGKRYGYFDTTPLTHALGEPCYIVQPYAPEAEIVPNGLPVFQLYYQNDDDASRTLGADSKLTFTVPSDGEYLLRIRDVRGAESDKHTYQLSLRPRQPDFTVTLQTKDPTINAGSAKEFRIAATRIDNFDGPIRVDITGLPAGYTVTTPMIIQAEQNSALGVIVAAADAPALTPETASGTKLTASADINGQIVTHEANHFGVIKSAPASKLTVRIAAAEGGANVVDPGDGSPLQVKIEPGQTIMLKVIAQRNGYDGNVPFGNEGSGRNLPHGVIVDNIGLNGLLILEKQDERNFFLTASKWVPDQDRLFHLQTGVEGGQATTPVLLQVRKNGQTASK